MPENSDRITPQLVQSARNMAAGACRRANAPHLLDDVTGAALEGLALADRDWDGRGRFAAYAIQRVAWRCRDELRRWRGRDDDARAVREAIPYGVSEADLERFLDAYYWNGRP